MNNSALNHTAQALKATVGASLRALGAAVVDMEAGNQAAIKRAADEADVLSGAVVRLDSLLDKLPDEPEEKVDRECPPSGGVNISEVSEILRRMRSLSKGRKCRVCGGVSPKA